MNLLKEKDPSLFRQSLSFTNKKDVLSKIENTDYFCHPETFYSRTRQFTSTYLCEHPIYKGYHLVFDLKHDPELIFSEKSNTVLKKTLSAAPKKYRTIKIGKNPFIQDKSFATKFDDEYSTLGHEILKKRADFIIKNRKELANRVSLIISDQFEDNSIDQTELIPEQMIFNLNPTSNDKSLMNNFVMTNNKDEQKKIHKRFNGPLKHLSEMILLDKWGKDGFDSNEEYKKVLQNLIPTMSQNDLNLFLDVVIDKETDIDKNILNQINNFRSLYMTEQIEILSENPDKFLIDWAEVKKTNFEHLLKQMFIFGIYSLIFSLLITTIIDLVRLVRSKNK